MDKTNQGNYMPNQYESSTLEDKLCQNQIRKIEVKALSNELSKLLEVAEGNDLIESIAIIVETTIRSRFIKSKWYSQEYLVDEEWALQAQIVFNTLSQDIDELY